MIRYARDEDIKGILELDKHISLNILQKKIANKEVYVLVHDDLVIGTLRYSLFWDNIPFMNMLYIKEGFQNKKMGSSLVDYWEEKMRGLGYTDVMTSTMSNEAAQHFYRKKGYKDVGGFILEGEPLELVFHKKISV